MIESGEVRLRAIEPADVDLLYQWENETEIWVVSNTLTPFSKHQLEKYVKHAGLDIYQTKQLRLMIEWHEAGQWHTTGMIDLFDFDAFHQRAGIGIMIHKPFRQKGVATQALSLFCDYCFKRLGLHQLYCSVMADNTASLALFQQEGFNLIGVKKDWVRTPNGFIDELFFQKIRP
jgi:diamine N-acetyltransferase